MFLAELTEVAEEGSMSDVACNPLMLPANITSINAKLQPLGSGDREYCFWVFSADLGPQDDPEVNNFPKNYTHALSIATFSIKEICSQIGKFCV